MTDDIEDFDFTNPELLNMVEEQRKRESLRADENRWPDQQGKRGPARKVGWQTILLVVDAAIQAIYFGRKMAPYVLQEFNTYNGANRLKYRLMKDYKAGLPAGVWNFAVESDEKKETFYTTAVYTPQKFSDIESIPKVAPEVKEEWVRYLREYADRMRSSQN